MNKSLFPVSQYGWNYIGWSVGFVLLSLLLKLSLFVFFFFFTTLFFLFLFRNPEREIVRFEEKSVLSPTDGIVSAIEPIENSYYAHKLTISSSILDVGILRSPCSAHVKSIHKHYGNRLRASNPLSCKLNEKIILELEDAFLNTIKIEYKLDGSFLPVVIDSKKEVTQSLRDGFMLNGTVILYLPHNFRFNVKVGDAVCAPKSLVGYFS
ncbi:phosphatidylserine decarboxylase [Sulfurimonas sp. SAG-AH-194-I05]|nr:phosphatidylserine decarboxylase [Sulfurimonas sp. SAG-AH-194-I05]MDF1874388.1 phosphatidylserine decarboxylase [Sulfurimonas sp. SAG-AH-194-I05]